MKKILFLFALIALVASVNAQTFKKARGVTNYFSYTGVAGDTIAGTTAGNFDFLIDMKEPYFFNVVVDFDTSLVAASNPNVVFKIAGSDDDVTYYDIGSSITWYGNSDTIVRFSNFSKTVTQSIASHTIVTTAYNEIHTNEITTNQDTVAVPQITNTVGTQTYTIAEVENAVTWRYLRIVATGAANARAHLNKVTLAILPKRY